MRSARRLPGLLLAAGLAAGAVPAHSAPLFLSRSRSYDVGEFCRSVAVGDLDADGIPDLVSANENPSTVSVFLGHGDGTFGPRSDYTAGTSTHGVAIGDVNHDGKPDLVTSNEGDGSVSILLGHGDGTFGASREFGTGGFPTFTSIRDLNGDTHPDLVVANGVNGVVVMLGNGDGTFQPGTLYATGIDPYHVVISDLNGDGKADLVVPNYRNDDVSVLFGNGRGAFGGKLDYSVGVYPLGVSIADLDGDGKVDLVVANQGSNTVSVLFGTGLGTFVNRTDHAVGDGPQSVAVDDFDHDGLADLAVSNAYDNTLSVLPGIGGGSLGEGTRYAAGTDPEGVVIADLDGDNHADIAIADYSTVSILFGNGDGTFGVHSTFPTGPHPSSAVADVNNDGKFDIVTANAGSISVLLGDGAGGFQARPDVATGLPAICLAAGDLDRDGNVDLTFPYGLNASRQFSVATMRGDGNGGFSGLGTLGVIWDGQPNSATMADVNRDGTPDLLMTLYGAVRILTGNGVGAYSALISLSVAGNPPSLAVADLNGDGKLDLATANSSSPTVSVLLGKGDGGFNARTDFAAGPAPSSVAIGDVNDDGKLDLAVADFGGSVSILLGNGLGGFGPPTAYATVSFPISVAIGDLDGDGKLDLVVLSGSRALNAFSILLGNGDGTFGPKVDYGTGFYPSSVQIVDLNGDAKPDLVVGNSLSNSVSVLLNTGGPSTPTLLTLFEAHWTADGIQVSWAFGPTADVRAVTLERRDVPDGPWSAVGAEPELQNGVEMLVDAEAPFGRPCDYRLEATMNDGHSTTFGPITATGALSTQFAVLPIAPNPSPGNAPIDFSVPRASRVRLRLMDVQGRQTAVLADGWVAPGIHHVDRDAMNRLATSRPGLYFVRLEWPGGAVTRRLVIAK